MLWQINSDARALPIKDETVQCVVTSPPYWGLRNYFVPGQLGLESSPEEYVAKMVAVFREVRRVLRDDGTLWLNLGDSYAGGGVAGSEKAFAGKQGSNRGSLNMVGRALDHGLKPKDLVGVPWRVAFALQADGWYLRQDLIWHKPNPMPESVTDRCTKAHEYIFLLAKSERYYFDAKAIAEPCVAGDNGSSYTSDYDKTTKTGLGAGPRVPKGKAITSPRHDGNTWNENNGRGFLPTSETRNKRSVWTIATQPTREAHFATFPEALVRPCILAGSRPGDLVLDPFAGTGTVGKVAVECGRKAVMADLKREYLLLDMKKRQPQIGMGI